MVTESPNTVYSLQFDVLFYLHNLITLNVYPTMTKAFSILVPLVYQNLNTLTICYYAVVSIHSFFLKVLTNQLLKRPLMQPYRQNKSSKW